MSKIEKYKDLVEIRKKCDECMKSSNTLPVKLINPSKFPSFDTEEIGHWSLWQNSLAAKILLVGQDWGTVDYLLKYKGRDDDNNVTNKNLIELFKVFGFDIGTPNNPKRSSELFFTNSILCLKTGKMDAKTEKEWHYKCGKDFLIHLINIIGPETIITIGEKAYKEVYNLYFPNENARPLKSAVATSKQLRENMFLYPAYHCSPKVEIIRKREQQRKDWETIKYHLDNHRQNK